MARLVLVVLASASCDLINTPTKMGNGQLYESGDAKYDPYFASVHEQQLAASKWPEESKAARKPVIVALSLRVGVSNSLLFSATREKKGDAAVGHAVDETTTAEREFARHLTAAATELDELLKRGEALQKDASQEKKNLGADKADEKKVAKKDEVRREVSAAVDAVESMMHDARKGAKEAEELASKLKGVWAGTDEVVPTKEEKKEEKEERREAEGKKDEKKKPEAGVKADAKKPKPAAKAEPAEKAEAPKKPAPKSEPEPKPEPKPAPAQKPPDEVFNP
jgi:hypothetical protein